VTETKPFVIPKALVWEAWQRVKANKGAAGVDGQSIAKFEADLKKNLYRIWNRMSSGSYFPPAVKAVPIPKKSGGERVLGVPTVGDRIAQTAVTLVLEPLLEPVFHDDSYGYRPGKSAHDALAVTRKRCWERDWVLEYDIRGLFDNIDHGLLLKALRRHCDERWVLLLVERWLTAPMQRQDGSLDRRTVGTPQGGPLSPVLANLFLHYALDRWLATHHPDVPFCRYADDGAPRRRTGGRKPSVQPCCTRDEGRPLEAAVQAEASNHPLLLHSRDVVVSELGKGRAGPCQVRTVESNASEPLMTCRKRRNGVKTGGESLLRDKSGRHLSTAQMASGMKAARTRSRLLCGTWEPVTPMPRERRKGQPPECLSTDAGYRDGATRSSGEGPVKGLERRGCPIRLGTREQLATGGLS